MKRIVALLCVCAMLFCLSGISVAAIPGEDRAVDLSVFFTHETTVTYKDVVDYLFTHEYMEGYLTNLPYTEMGTSCDMSGMYLDISGGWRFEADVSLLGLNPEYAEIYVEQHPRSDFGNPEHFALEIEYEEPFGPSGQACILFFTDEMLGYIEKLSYSERLMYIAAIYLELCRDENVNAWYYVSTIGLTQEGSERHPTKELGDANGDYSLNALDLLIIKKYLAGYEPAFNPYLADINRDNRISMLDVFQLKKLFVFGKNT